MLKDDSTMATPAAPKLYSEKPYARGPFLNHRYLGFRVQGLLGDLWLEGIGEVRSFGVYIRGVWAGLLNSG